MGLGDVYRGIEDKYYGAVDWLDKKGISLYPVIDRIEKHNIPSFPIAVLVLILIIAGIFLLVSMFAMPSAMITFVVTEEQTGIAVAGATVTVTMESGTEVTNTTDAEGKAELAVPFGEATAKIEKTDYEKKTVLLSVSGSEEKQVELKKQPQMLTKTIQLMRTGTNQLISGDATIEFTCSGSEAADFDETRNAVGGTITLDVPSNCGSLIATPIGNFTTPDGVIDLQDAAPQIFLQPVETNTGTVRVSVENEDGQALSGVTVMAYTQDGLLAGTQYSSAAGSASFEVPTGTYYVVLHDSQGRYADYDSSLAGEQGLKELVKDATVTFDVVLAQATVGRIRVIARDASTRQPVQDATVYLKSQGTVLDTAYTGADGIVEFSVSENIPYSLEVDADAYLIAVVSNVTAGESFNEIYLEAATADNTQVLNVEVVDNRDSPIEGTRLVLKKADGTIYANNVVTGADGKGSFTNLPLETYYVYAVKKGFDGRNSDPITLRARQENKVKVVLPIGFGNLEVAVLDDELQPVQGAVVEAINSVSREKEQEEITGLDGKTIFNFRADKVVYFKVDAEGFLPYYSMTVMPDADSTVTTEVVLAKDSGSVEVRLLGLYYDGELAPKELTPGNKYTAKLLLLIPKDSSFGEAGVHLRVGGSEEGKTNIMEEDSLYIRNIVASTANILRGTSYTPPLGYGADSGHLTTGNSKWVNLAWKNVSQGAYAVEAEIQVKDSALLGQMLYVSYRGWAKSGAYLRFPADAALAGADSTAVKQALYANAKQRAYTAGPSNLCGINFCKTFGIEDRARNIKVSVVNQYNATIGGSYRLNFLISSTADQAFTNSEIEFGSNGDGLRFGNYAITDATGIRNEGEAQAYTLSKEIGDMRKESSVFGYVDFKAEKEGDNILNIVIKSNSQPVMTEAINIRVEAAEQLQIDIIPKEIIPMIDNDMLVKVSDSNGQAVSNAMVTVTLNDELVLSRESNGSGVVEFKLEAPATGSKLKIKAEKTGYKSIEVEVAVDEEILRITPPEIKEKLSPELVEVEKQIWLSNQTVSEFAISKLKFSPEFEGLVEFDWDEDYVGEKIPSTSDLNAFLIMKLTEKGKMVQKPVKLEGSLSIYLLSPETNLTFVQNLPIEIRIALGGEADDDACIQITPVEWEVITSSDEAISQLFEVKNNCAVEGTGIALSSFGAKLVTGKENLLGTFTISSDDIPDMKPTVIGEDFIVLADVIPENFEGTLEIQFKAGSEIDSGKAKQSIEFEAVHSTVKGEEKVSAKLPVDIQVNNLAKCIEIIAEEPIVVETMPFNLGYGNYGMGYNPSYGGGYGGYGMGGYGTGSMGGYGMDMYGAGGYGGGYGTGSYGYGGTPSGGGYLGGNYLGGSMYPYPNYRSSYYTNYYDTAENESWRYGLGENSFIVKNNCSTDVEIDLDVPSRLMVKEDKFELSPNTDKTVVVESGYRMGKYELGVLAKVKESEDKAVKVDDLDVIVRRAGEIDEECIELSSTKISLNNFIGKPVKNEIYNYCYDVGVKLPSGGNVIQFMCKVAGQPMNTYRFAEDEGEKAMLQSGQGYIGGDWQNYKNPSTGQPYNYPFSQPSSYYNQAPSSTGLYSPGEAYASTGPWGSAYGQAGLSSQGYSYPTASYPYGSTGWAQAQVGNYRDQCELIDSVTSSPPTTKGDSEGKTIETVQFEVRPALNYRKMLCNFMGNAPFQSIFGLRVMLSQTYYRVHVDSEAYVKYYNPFGGSTTKYFKVTLEDLWGIGDTLDECLRNATSQKCQVMGQPTATGDACINKNSLNFTGRFGSTKGIVPQALFAGNVAQVTPEEDVLNVSPSACGARDNLELITNSYTDPKSNVSIFLETVPTDCGMFKGHWNVKVTVNRAGMNAVQCAKISTGIRARVKKASGFGTVTGETKEVTIPLNMIVAYPGVDEGTIDIKKCDTLNTDPNGNPLPGGGIPVAPVTTEVKCETGITGGAFESLGFDRLLFSWDWGDVKADACDEAKDSKAGKFCDAVQFSIELNRKAEALKEFVEKNKAAWEGQYKETMQKVLCPEETDAAKAGECLKKYYSSDNLYRWIFTQAKVKDNFAGTTGEGGAIEKDLLFFVGNDGKILANEKAEFEESVKTKAANVKTFATNKNWAQVVDQMQLLLNEMQNSKARDSIVVEIKTTEFAGSSGETILKKFGANIEAPLTDYVMTFNEFRLFHSAIKAGLDNFATTCFKADGTTRPAKKEEAVRCEVAYPLNAGKGVVEAEFLKKVYSNMTFKAGILEQKEMSENTIEQVVVKAKQLNGLTWPADYGSFEKLYNGTIKFRSYLVKDGYSKALRTDFDSAYRTLGGSALTTLDKTRFKETGWTFGGRDSTVLAEAGLYNVTVKLDFASDYKWDVKIDLNKGLAKIDEASNSDKAKRTKYADNAFFSLPIDGEVKGKDGKRDGYGIALSGVGEAAPYISYETSEKKTRFIGTSSGFENKAITFTYGNSFASTSAGTILSVTGTAIAFNPSTAAKVELDLGGRLQGSEGVLYELLQDATNEMDHSKAESILTWYGTDGTGFRDEKVPKTRGMAVCTEVTREHYGFVKDTAQAAKYMGLAFVPLQSSYVLRIYCNQGNATLNALERVNVPAGYRATGATSYQVRLNETGKVEQNSLYAFINKIKGQEVCVETRSGGLELTWNRSKLLEGFVKEGAKPATPPAKPADTPKPA